MTDTGDAKRQERLLELRERNNARRKATSGNPAVTCLATFRANGLHHQCHYGEGHTAAHRCRCGVDDS